MTRVVETWGEKLKRQSLVASDRRLDCATSHISRRPPTALKTPLKSRSEVKDQQKEMQWTTNRDTERLCSNDDDDDDAIKSPILSSNAVTTSSVSIKSPSFTPSTSQVSWFCLLSNTWNLQQSSSFRRLVCRQLSRFATVIRRVMPMVMSQRAHTTLLQKRHRL